MFISKRLLFILGVVIVIVMLAAGIGLAYAFSALSQQSTANANLSATATAAALASPTPGKANGQRRVVGTVKSLGNQSFVLSANQGKRTITVEVGAQTKYVRAGKSASFADLQVGETVAVLGTYDATSQTMTATRITIAPATTTPTPTPSATP